jgi:hypothetical protein
VDYLTVNQPSAWYYCDYREQSSQTPANLIASLLRQFSIQTERIPKELLDFYQLYKNEPVQSHARELLEILSIVCSNFDQCFVFIDALDEVDRKHRKEFMKVIQDLKKGSLKIFVTSRPHLQDIISTFSKDVQIDVAADQSDIRRFVSRILDEDDNMQDLLDEALRRCFEHPF